MKGILIILICAFGLSAKGQTPGDHLVKASDHQMAALSFTVGGSFLYWVADREYNKTTSPPLRDSYKILKYFSAGCILAGLYFEVISIYQFRKAGLLLRANPTGLNLSYRFNSNNSRSSFQHRF